MPKELKEHTILPNQFFTNSWKEIIMKGCLNSVIAVGICLVIVLPFIVGCQEDKLVSEERLKNQNAIEDDKHYSIGINHIKSGHFEEAIKPLKKYVSLRPNDAEAHCNLGFAYIDLGRYEQAIKPLTQAIHLKSDLAEAHCNVGIAYIGLGRLEEAIEATKRAITLKPDYAEAQGKLGLAYIMLGRCEEAIIPLKQAISLKPDYAGTHFGLGAAYAKLGNRESALEQYEILKKLDNKMAAVFLREFNKQSATLLTIH